MTDGCVFCGYAGPNPILGDYGDAYVVAPLHPVTDGHVLAVARRHHRDALAGPGAFGRTAEIAARYAREAGVDACNIITSVGPAASQSVDHLHVHLVPRSLGDGIRLPWG